MRVSVMEISFPLYKILIGHVLLAGNPLASSNIDTQKPQNISARSICDTQTVT